MLAAPLTPFPDLIVDQYRFLATLPTPLATQAMVDDMSTRRDNVWRLLAAGGHEEEKGAPLPLDLPPSLWFDMARYDPAAALAAQPALPSLLTFGGRDFQVPIREKDLWEARTAGRKNVEIAVFEPVNHLLVDGEGPMTPAEYDRPGHVSPLLIDRVAAWIAARAGAGR